MDHKAILVPLAPDTPITRANLAQALAEIMAQLPEVTDATPPGTLVVNGAFLQIAK